MAKLGEPLLTVEAVAEILRLKPCGIVSLTRRNVLPVVKLDRRCVRYRWSDVERAIQRLQAETF